LPNGTAAGLKFNEPMAVGGSSRRDSVGWQVQWLLALASVCNFSLGRYSASHTPSISCRQTVSEADCSRNLCGGRSWLLLRLRGGGQEGGPYDDRKRKAALAHAHDAPQGKRARVATGEGGGGDGNGKEGDKGMVRIPRDLLKKLRAVMKEVLMSSIIYAEDYTNSKDH
jgi:hypothetical protein